MNTVAVSDALQNGGGSGGLPSDGVRIRCGCCEKTIVETTSRYFELSRKLTCGKTMVVQCDGFNYVE